MTVSDAGADLLIGGRYVLSERIASGGMASVYLARQVGAGGFSRAVAVKRVHQLLVEEPDFNAMFLDEARIAARIHHPNVVATLDVVAERGELFLVMEYIRGESLSSLLRTHLEGKSVALEIVSRIMSDVLRGLHAAHEATSESGAPLGIVHRDVSPQNILVGTDGVSRVLDFGVAKAEGRLHNTKTGHRKGKVRYMSPEQLRSEAVDRRSDLYAAGVVLWEALARRRLFEDENAAMYMKVVETEFESPAKYNAEVTRELEAIVKRALAFKADDRFQTALAFAEALEACVSPASTPVVGAWVQDAAKESLDRRAALVQAVESSGSGVGMNDPTTTGPGIPTAPPKRRWLVYPLGFGAALGLVAAAFALGAHSEPRAAAPPPVTSAPPNIVAAPSTASTAAASVSFTASVASVPAASATTAPRVAAARPATSKAAPSASARGKDCSQPYTRDALGRKIYRAECVE